MEHSVEVCSEEAARQIATLVNKMNGLNNRLHWRRVYNNADRFFTMRDNETKDIVATVKLSKLNWYLHEISYLSVNREYQRMGLATTLLDLAETKARKESGKLVIATIRNDNEPSIRLFCQRGYTHGAIFHNPYSDTQIGAYLKRIT